MNKTSMTKCVGAAGAISALLLAAAGSFVIADGNFGEDPFRIEWQFPGLIERNPRVPSVCRQAAAYGEKIGYEQQMITQQMVTGKSYPIGSREDLRARWQTQKEIGLDAYKARLDAAWKQNTKDYADEVATSQSMFGACEIATKSTGCMEAGNFSRRLKSKMSDRYYEIMLGRTVDKGPVPSVLGRLSPFSPLRIALNELRDQLGSEEFNRRSQAVQGQVMQEFASDVEKAVKKLNRCATNWNALK